MKAYKKTFDNGVRLLTVPMKDSPAVTVMALTTVGSHNEKKEHQGVAHFLEHMALKGGEKYSTPYQVSSTLDSLGARSNAFTGGEYTGYYAKGHYKHFGRLLDVISDVYLRPRLDEQELERERGVIIEEINMYDDIPRERVATILEELMYGDQPAGWPIAGTKEVIRSMDRETMRKFHEKHYNSANTVVLVAGNVTSKEATAEVGKYFASLPESRPSKRSRPKVSQKEPAVKTESRSTDQVHFRIGIHAYPASDKRIPTLLVLNAVLGGGMSSRLFQKLREEMGVCYYVGSGIEDHDKYGNLVISAGVDTKRVYEVVEVIAEELRRLREEEVDKKELKKAKDYLIGNLFLNLETSSGLGNFYLEQEILTGELKTPYQVAKEIRAVEVKDVKKAARDLLVDKKLNLAAVGKDLKTASLKKKLTLGS